MNDKELPRFPAHRLIAHYLKHTLSPVEVVQACLKRIEKLNHTLHAYITVLAEEALEQAHEAERAYMRGTPHGILEGVPISAKDVFATKDLPTTWGLRELAQYLPHYNSSVLTKLREAGAILLGKANLDTYTYQGSAGSPRLIGPTLNPWDLKRIAGRSSGGAGASVAASFD